MTRPFVQATPDQWQGVWSDSDQWFITLVGSLSTADLRARRDKPSELREEQRVMQREMEETRSGRIQRNFILLKSFFFGSCSDATRCCRERGSTVKKRFRFFYGCIVATWSKVDMITNFEFLERMSIV